MSITDVAPVIAAERIFPTCIHWCGWHWAEDTPEEPGCCWAQDVQVDGVVEVMATYDEHRTRNHYEWPKNDEGGSDYAAEPVVTQEPLPPLLITAFRADLPSFDEGIEFASIEAAEATAHSILAMVARIRGDEQLAQVHLTAGITAATEAGR
ncbi:hypothetical protein KDL01_04235 [Actinospica durhamensis]|uniref:Uncharacterized protein n=1 Tax=Actinospica durhamensis TaxID=1508375 RepID=A0A941IRN3_9ACTN|nr:hypothetical protein [Actinospica durhamensis]MBR7832451.1 hypothetical protein [Actinospica durhamensis]